VRIFSACFRRAFYGFESLIWYWRNKKIPVKRGHLKAHIKLYETIFATGLHNSGGPCSKPRWGPHSSQENPRPKRAVFHFPGKKGWACPSFSTGGKWKKLVRASEGGFFNFAVGGHSCVHEHCEANPGRDHKAGKQKAPSGKLGLFCANKIGEKVYAAGRRLSYGGLQIQFVDIC